MTYPVTAAAGIPETVLPDDFVAQLPPIAPPAPWHTTADVITWLHPLDDDARETIPSSIRPEKIAIVAWALVRYADTPVGPYSEIAATLIPEGGDGFGHIPFIVVDSLPSIVGGRTNWLLPKALARFDWKPSSVLAHSEQPAEPAWEISVSWSQVGEAADLSFENNCEQVGTDGVPRRFTGQISGSMTPTTVTVEGHADGPLSTLLVPGTYDGTMLSNATFDVGGLI